MKKEYTGPMRLAHRGLVQYAPENTLGAFEAALDHGFEGIEIDVQLSGDGEVIVAHDPNFTRMTLGSPTNPSNRRIREMTVAEIQAIDIPYANHLLPRALPPHTEVESMAIMPSRLMGQESGSDYIDALSRDRRMTHLMTFAEFDAWFSTRGERALIEIEVKAPGMMPRLAAILNASPNVDRYVLGSGVPEYLEEMQGYCAEHGRPGGIRLGANLRQVNEQTLAFVDRADLYEVGLNDQCFGPDEVRLFADRGIRVFSNLGDYPGWWEKLAESGCMAFKTNYAEAYTDWWEARDRRP